MPVARALAVCVVAAHLGQLTAPHVASVVQLVAAEGNSQEDQDSEPEIVGKQDVKEGALVRAAERLRGPLQRLHPGTLAAARAPGRAAAAAAPRQTTARLTHRSANLVRLLL